MHAYDTVDDNICCFVVIDAFMFWFARSQTSRSKSFAHSYRSPVFQLNKYAPVFGADIVFRFFRFSKIRPQRYRENRTQRYRRAVAASCETPMKRRRRILLTCKNPCIPVYVMSYINFYGQLHSRQVIVSCGPLGDCRRRLLHPSPISPSQSLNFLCAPPRKVPSRISE